MKSWYNRNLTLQGKVTVINTLIVPQFLYMASVLKLHDNQVKKIKDLIINFLWNNKPAKIKYSTMIAPKSRGGYGLQDITLKLKAIALRWIKLIGSTSLPWHEFLQQRVKIPLEEVIHGNLKSEHLPNLIDPFYQDMFRT